MKLGLRFLLPALSILNTVNAQQCTETCGNGQGVTRYTICRESEGTSQELCLPDAAIDTSGNDYCGECYSEDYYDQDGDGFIDGMCPGDHRKLAHHPEFNITVSCPHGNGEPETFLGFDFHNNSGIYAGMYADGWCIDVDRAIYCDEEFKVDSYSSYDSYHIPEGAIDKPQDLDQINWLINNFHQGSELNIPECNYVGTLRWEEYQEAIWTIIDHYGAIDLGAEQCIVEYLVRVAGEEGEGFQVSCENTEKIGVVMVIDDDSGFITHQVVLAEVYLEHLKEHGICNCTRDGYVFGDPHFMTWSGEHYDFHGLCDLVLLENHGFQNDLGMDIHIRTKKMRSWSYISNAVVRIGDDSFEVMGGKEGSSQYWINGIIGERKVEDGVLLPEGVAGFPITFKLGPKNQNEYHVDLGNNEVIVVKTWNDLVRVDVHGATRANFGRSLGLMGTYGGGQHVARDGFTVIEDMDEFGQEWQVLKTEAKFFHNLEGSQAPQKCEIPSATEMRRRLAESLVSQEDAEIACADVPEEVRDMCVFDVMATNHADVAGAY